MIDYWNHKSDTSRIRQGPTLISRAVFDLEIAVLQHKQPYGTKYGTWQFVDRRNATDSPVWCSHHSAWTLVVWSWLARDILTTPTDILYYIANVWLTCLFDAEIWDQKARRADGWSAPFCWWVWGVGQMLVFCRSCSILPRMIALLLVTNVLEPVGQSLPWNNNRLSVSYRGDITERVVERNNKV